MAASQSSPSWLACYPALAKTLAKYGGRWSAVAIATAEAIPNASHLSSWDWFEALDCIDAVLRPVLPPTSGTHPTHRSTLP